MRMELLKQAASSCRVRLHKSRSCSTIIPTLTRREQRHSHVRLRPVILKKQWYLEENQTVLFAPWARAVGSSTQNQVPLNCPFRSQGQLYALVGMVIQPWIPHTSQMLLVRLPLDGVAREWLFPGQVPLTSSGMVRISL